MNLKINGHDLLNTYINKAYGYRALGICNKNKWLPLKRSAILAKVVGHLMGDGNLSKDPMAGCFRFYGSKEKLANIKSVLEVTFNLFPKYYALYPEGGNCYLLKYNNCIFSRLLHLAGVPRGDKILQHFSIPSWIMKGSLEIKKSFLRAIFTDEMCGMYRSKKGTWKGLEFQMSKSREYLTELLYFLNQIITLLHEFNIITNEAKIKDTSIFFRKDGHITYAARFRVSLKPENRRKFYHSIGFDETRKQKLLYASLINS